MIPAVLSVIPWGQLLGLGGSVLNIWQKNIQNKHDLAMKQEDMKLLIAKGNVDQATLAGELAKLREEGANKGFEMSYADSIATKGGPFTNGVRNFTRPGLTWWFVMAFYSMTLCVLRGIGAAYFDHPLAQYTFVTTANMMEMCVTWWFGQRQMVKMTTSWGNSMVNAKVSGQVSK